MKRKSFQLITLLFITVAASSCVDKNPTIKEPLDTQALTKNQKEVHGTLIKPEDITLTNPLNESWVGEGRALYNVKCESCHKLTDEKLVGPGWAGLTKRRKPDWIMNMITNVEIMLEKDPVAQRLLEDCIVRMPNQSLTKDEARKVLEFQRKNDGEN
jgi:mono/diheme cytochrome c family protein